MQIIQLTSQSDPPYKTDLLLIEKDGAVSAHTVVMVKYMDDDYEIILNKRKNIWFSWRQYTAGKSWVKDCRVVLP